MNILKHNGGMSKLTLSKQIRLLLTANRKGAEEVQHKQLGKDVVGLYVIGEWRGNINILSPAKMVSEWFRLKLKFL